MPVPFSRPLFQPPGPPKPEHDPCRPPCNPSLLFVVYSWAQKLAFLCGHALDSPTAVPLPSPNTVVCVGANPQTPVSFQPVPATPGPGPPPFCAPRRHPAEAGRPSGAARPPPSPPPTPPRRIVAETPLALPPALPIFSPKSSSAENPSADPPALLTLSRPPRLCAPLPAFSLRLAQRPAAARRPHPLF